MLQIIYSEDDLAALVQQYGFLPFMKNQIPGFSVEEHTPPELWFAEDQEGPWEWKGPAIEKAGCAYGKFFGGKAGFIARDWFCDFANYRRDGYDFEGRYEDGLIRQQDKLLYDVLQSYPSLLSRQWHRLSGIQKRSAFDASVARLQMQGFVITIGFEYALDKYGNPRGWAISRCATPENFWGNGFTDHIYDRDPAESGRRIERHLMELLPQATQAQVLQVIGKRK